MFVLFRLCAYVIFWGISMVNSWFLDITVILFIGVLGLLLLVSRICRSVGLLFDFVLWCAQCGFVLMYCWLLGVLLCCR